MVHKWCLNAFLTKLEKTNNLQKKSITEHFCQNLFWEKLSAGAKISKDIEILYFSDQIDALEFYDKKIPINMKAKVKNPILRICNVRGPGTIMLLASNRLKH